VFCGFALDGCDVVEFVVAVAGEVAEFGCPPGNVAGAFEEFVDFAAAFVGGLVEQKGTDFGGGWQGACDIETDTAEEFGIGAEVGLDDAHLPQFLDNEFVNFGGCWDVWVVLAILSRDGANHGDWDDGAVVEGDDMSISGGGCSDEPFLGDVCDLIIVCLEATERGDIFPAAV
jgi:hypothetical protein